MNGGQDLGGMMGFGPINPEPDEFFFHADWERRVLALTLAMGATGSWNIDQSRYARESIDPGKYLTWSYYRIWLEGLNKLIMQAGLADSQEIVTGKSALPPARLSRKLLAEDVEKVLAAGGPAFRQTKAKARLKVADRVRTKNINPSGHTRLARYLRGHQGEIVHVHGAHVFPDASAGNRGECPQFLYTVRFCARELWGTRPDPAILSMLISGNLISSRNRKHRGKYGMNVSIALGAVPSIPRDDEGPVFAEPWQAQAFAMAVSLNQQGVFTWSEWVRTLAVEIARDGSPEAYYANWLTALETLVTQKGLIGDEERNARKAAWDRASRATPHGEPIILGRERRDY